MTATLFVLGGFVAGFFVGALAVTWARRRLLRIACERLLHELQQRLWRKDPQWFEVGVDVGRLGAATEEHGGAELRQAYETFRDEISAIRHGGAK